MDTSSSLPGSLVSSPAPALSRTCEKNGSLQSGSFQSGSSQADQWPDLLLSAKGSETANTAIAKRQAEHHKSDHPTMDEGRAASPRQKLASVLRNKRRQRGRHVQQERDEYQENIRTARQLKADGESLPMVERNNIRTDDQNLCLHKEDQQLLERYLLWSDACEGFHREGRDIQLKGYSVERARRKKRGLSRRVVSEVDTIYDQHEMKCAFQFIQFSLAIGDVFPLAVQAMERSAGNVKATKLLQLALQVGIKAWMYLIRLDARQSDITWNQSSGLTPAQSEAVLARDIASYRSLLQPVVCQFVVGCLALAVMKCSNDRLSASLQEIKQPLGRLLEKDAGTLLTARENLVPGIFLCVAYWCENDILGEAFASNLHGCANPCVHGHHEHELLKEQLVPFMASYHAYRGVLCCQTLDLREGMAADDLLAKASSMGRAHGFLTEWLDQFDCPDVRDFLKYSKKYLDNMGNVADQLKEKARKALQPGAIDPCWIETADVKPETGCSAASESGQQQDKSGKPGNGGSAKDRRKAAYRRCASKSANNGQLPVDRAGSKEEQAQADEQQSIISQAFSALEDNNKALAHYLLRAGEKSSDPLTQAWALLGLGNLSLEISPAKMDLCLQAGQAIDDYQRAVDACLARHSEGETGLPDVDLYNRFVAAGTKLQTGLEGMRRSLSESQHYYLQLITHIQAHPGLKKEDELMKEVRELLVQTHPELEQLRVISENFLVTARRRMELIWLAGARRTYTKPTDIIIANRQALEESQKAAEMFCDTLSKLNIRC